MKIVIDIPEEVKQKIDENLDSCDLDIYDCVMLATKNGTPLPKGHSFIAICDSDFPITEEVKQELKDTAFVGNEECNYCFDMTEIIEVESEEKIMDRNCENCKRHTENGCTSWECEYEPKNTAK